MPPEAQPSALAYHGSEGARQVKMITVPRTVLQLQYEAVRLPIVVLDAWVLGRYLAEESGLSRLG